MTISRRLSFFALWGALGVLFSSTAVRADTPFEYTIKRLQLDGFSKEFIRELYSYEALSSDPKNTKWQSWIDKVILSVYLRSNYSGQVSDDSASRVFQFLKAHLDTFNRAETKFGVQKEAIGSLFWIETKVGTAWGKEPVVQVFFSLAGSDCPERQKATLARYQELVAQEKIPIDLRVSEPEAKKRIAERARKKVDWALTELHVLERLYQQDQAYRQRTHKKSPRNIFSWMGSYAGAFGIGQFLPSSYELSALSAHSKKGKYRPPNLFDPDDAIFSTANFLHKEWGTKPGEHSDALYKYNREKAYGAAILEIYGKVLEIVKVKSLRTPASRSGASATATPAKKRTRSKSQSKRKAEVPSAT